MKKRLINDWAIEVYDFDITKATLEQAHEIACDTVSNMVVVIKKQDMTSKQEEDFCSMIGQCQRIIDPTKPRSGQRTEHMAVDNYILRVTGKPNDKGEEGLFGHTSALDWHANQASNYERKPLIWLYGVEGTKGSRTSWINMIEAYNDLDPVTKEDLQDVEITLGYKSGSYSESKFFHEHHASDRPFKLVHTNDAGKTGLYFPFLQIFGMKGKDDKEFAHTMHSLTAHVLTDKYRYDHDWDDGDIVLSEQWLSIHKRWQFEDMKQRVLHRIAFDYSKVDYEHRYSNNNSS